jgi:hypothetical protein
MKAYLITTGLTFGAITLIHIWRFIEEGPGLLTDHFWVVATVIAAALCAWACRLLWLSRRSGSPFPRG